MPSLTGRGDGGTKRDAKAARRELYRGMILDAVMLHTNAFARIAMCGMIAGYNGVPLPMANPALILVNRLKVEGFIVSEHMELWPQALKELGALVAGYVLITAIAAPFAAKYADRVTLPTRKSKRPMPEPTASSTG